VRELFLDGRWAEAEELLAPLSHARGFDHSAVLFQLRRQRFKLRLRGRFLVKHMQITQLRQAL